MIDKGRYHSQLLTLPLREANGVLGGMKLRIDKAGCLVLPKSVRSQLGITPETTLELVQSADGILLRRVVKGEDRGFIGVRSIAETYAALTRLLVQPRIHPNEAGRIIRENIVGHSTIVPAGEAEYLQAPAESQARICTP
ncbi:MAG: AbrB/MazE/SpoVT family DNA-binding domain-containing protein [Aquabacterium sp.]|nr:AbrB/MazE/SpoVT family DNA-binding domain-containing protein [Aquabacterium sp.]